MHPCSEEDRLVFSIDLSYSFTIRARPSCGEDQLWARRREHTWRLSIRSLWHFLLSTARGDGLRARWQCTGGWWAVASGRVYSV